MENIKLDAEEVIRQYVQELQEAHHTIVLLKVRNAELEKWLEVLTKETDKDEEVNT